MTASPPLQPFPNLEVLRELYDADRAPAKLAFIDCETTGLDVDRNQIWEVAVIVDEPARREERWYLEVDMERADSDALRIGGYYQRHPAATGPWEPSSPRQVAHELAKLTAGAHLVGVNPAFDATFVGRFIRECGYVPAWEYHLCDVLPLIAGRFGIAPPWRSRDLGALVGAPAPEGEERHSALGDARWAEAMYRAVISGPGPIADTRPFED